MTDARDEAIRLAKEAELETVECEERDEYTGDKRAVAVYSGTADQIKRLIALARAKDAPAKDWVAPEVYEAVVRGRQQFRQLYRETRLDARRWRQLVKCKLFDEKTMTAEIDDVIAGLDVAAPKKPTLAARPVVDASPADARQEPVAWMSEDGESFWSGPDPITEPGWIGLYASPPAVAAPQERTDVDKRDAERYRFIRGTGLIAVVDMKTGKQDGIDGIDAAIDAAIRAAE